MADELLTPEELRNAAGVRAVVAGRASASRYHSAERAAEAQLAKVLKHRLDRPDREKIAKWLQLNDSQHIHDWDDLPDYIKQSWLEKADQLLALIPDEEEIKKQIEVLRQDIIKVEKQLDDREADLIEAKRKERIETGDYLEHCHLSPHETHRLISIHDIERLKSGQALKG